MGANHRAARTRRPRLAANASLRGALALGVVALAATALAATACGGSNDDTPAPPPVTFLPQPTAPGAVPGDPGLTIRNVVQACREKDAERLRGFVAPDVALADITAMFAGGSDVVLRLQSVPDAPEDRTSITVLLEIRRDGQIDEVERTWDLVLEDDGVWRLTQLPNCF